MNSGIYKIINNRNGRVYFGSAIDLNKRKQNHFSDLKLNKHGNQFLQHDYNKCGSDAFEFVVEKFCTVESLLKEEQLYLDKHHDNQNKCYNIDNTAGSRLGSKASEETREKLRISHLGKNQTQETKRKISQNNRLKSRLLDHNPMYGIGSRVAKVDKKTDEIIEIFETMNQASRLTKVNHGHICDACNGKRHSAGGFRWKKI